MGTCKFCGKENEELRFGACWDCASSGEVRLAKRTVLGHLRKMCHNLRLRRFDYAQMDLACAWERFWRVGSYAKDGYFDSMGIDWRNSAVLLLALFLTASCWGQTSAPLGSHSVGYALEGARSDLGGAGISTMGLLALACIPAYVGRKQRGIVRDKIGGYEWRQILQPQAGGLRERVAELVGLDRLIGVSPALIELSYGVLNRNFFNSSIPQAIHKFRSLIRHQLTFWKFPPTCPGPAEVGAWGMGNHQVPPVGQLAEHVALNMRPRTFGGQQVAGYSIVPARYEGIADGAGEFTGYQDSHTIGLRHRFSLPRDLRSLSVCALAATMLLSYTAFASPPTPLDTAARTQQLQRIASAKTWSQRQREGKRLYMMDAGRARAHRVNKAVLGPTGKAK